MATRGPILNHGGGQGGQLDETGLLWHQLVFLESDETQLATCGYRSWNGMPEKRGGRTWQKTAGELGEYIVKIRYEGIPAGVDELEKWSWLPVKTEEPIAAHPLVELLIARYGGEAQADGTVKFPRFLPEDFTGGGPDGLKAAGNLNVAGEGKVKNPMFGWETYIKKGLIVRRQFRSRNFPQRLVELDGTVVDSTGNPDFPAYDDRDFLVWVGPITTEGNPGEDQYFAVTVDYVISNRGGWPPMHWLVDRLQ
jgi:hypothetical protein